MRVMEPGMEGTLAAATAFALVATALYARVGLQHATRAVSAQNRRAVRMFGTWWLALAGVTLLGGVNTLLASIDASPLALLSAVLYVQLLLICVGLLGLLHYLVFLFTGRDLALPLGAVYAAYFIALVAVIAQAHPIDVNVGRWSATVVYEHPLASTSSTLLLALLVLPQIVGAVAYLTVAFRVREATQRFRIVLVSVSIIVWFGSSLLASARGLSGADWWQVLSRALGLAAALATFVAYNPPRVLTERWGVEALTTGASGDGGADVRERTRHAAARVPDPA